MTARRGTSNGSARGSVYDRRRRRAWLVATYASDVPGLCRCYRCGDLLFNPDAPLPAGWWVADGSVRARTTQGHLWVTSLVQPLTVDRIVPGCQGGTYRRNNIRPACSGCNSETGGSTRRKVAQT